MDWPKSCSSTASSPSSPDLIRRLRPARAWRSSLRPYFRPVTRKVSYHCVAVRAFAIACRVPSLQRRGRLRDDRDRSRRRSPSLVVQARLLEDQQSEAVAGRAGRRGEAIGRAQAAARAGAQADLAEGAVAATELDLKARGH